MNRNLITLGAAVIASAAGGAVGGYFFAKRQLETKYADLASMEIDQARVHYARLYKRDEFMSPAKAVEVLIPEGDDPKVNAAADALTAYQGAPAETKEEAKVVVNNIFANGPAIPVVVDEDEPHLIPEEEYLANETGYEQYSMTYYLGDGVLADDRDQPVEGDKLDETVGDNNLTHFQNLPENEHIIYVRNNKLRAEFEISKSDGNYAEEVLGLGSR
jgi:hypothetical protein